MTGDGGRLGLGAESPAEPIIRCKQVRYRMRLINGTPCACVRRARPNRMGTRGNVHTFQDITSKYRIGYIRRKCAHTLPVRFCGKTAVVVLVHERWGGGKGSDGLKPCGVR